MPTFQDFCSCNGRKEKSRKICKRCDGVESIVLKITFYSNIFEESEQHRVAFVHGREVAHEQKSELIEAKTRISLMTA